MLAAELQALSRMRPHDARLLRRAAVRLTELEALVDRYAAELEQARRREGEAIRTLAGSSQAEAVPAPQVATSPDPQLSPREWEVYDRVVRGQSDRQIAATLGIRVSTVRNRLEDASVRLRHLDPSLPDVSPRRVILAHHAAAVGRAFRVA